MTPSIGAKYKGWLLHKYVLWKQANIVSVTLRICSVTTRGCARKVNISYCYLDIIFIERNHDLSMGVCLFLS